MESTKNIVDCQVTGSLGVSPKSQLNPLDVENVANLEIFNDLNDVPSECSNLPIEDSTYGKAVDKAAGPEDRELLDVKLSVLAIPNHFEKAKAETQRFETSRQRFSGANPKTQRAGNSESHSKHISFKLPELGTSGAESFGFSFSPRFRGTSGSSRTLEPKAALNPFENIERQGRCSPLNHPRSPPGSRHHSRSSSTGLLVLRHFPLAMKTSKETGDQPPLVPLPPLISCSDKLYNSVKSFEGLERTPEVEPGSYFGGELCLGRESNIGGGFESNVGSLDIKDFNIPFPPKQELGPHEVSSVNAKAKNSRSSGTKPASNRSPCDGNQSSFAVFGTESTWTGRCRAAVEVQGEEITPGDNTNPLAKSD